MKLTRSASFQLTFGVVLLLVLAIGPYALGRGSAGIFINFAIVAVFAYSWNIVGGILGELNFAHIIPWGVGGYGAIFLTSAGISLPLAVLISAALAAFLSMLIVIIAHFLNLEGLYLAIVTLILAELAIELVGISEPLGEKVGLRLPFQDRFGLEAYHFGSIGLLAVSVIVTYMILRSLRGLRWQALRDDPVAARSMGVAVTTEKAIGYAVAGTLAALGGALQAHYLGFAQPTTSLSIGALVLAVMCVYAGGPGTLFGPAIGALLLQGFASVVTYLSADETVVMIARLVQYAVAIILIRWFVSRSGGGDLISMMVPRRQEPTQEVVDGELAVPEDHGPQSERISSPLTVNEALPELMIPTHEKKKGVLLEVDGLAKAFGGLKILKDVSFSVSAGEFTALVGPNGAGKSTVVNLINGLILPDTGVIRMGGEDITRTPANRRFQQGIVRTFQTPRLFSRLSLLDNTALACDNNKEFAEAALRQLGVTGIERSSGEATLYEHRLVEIARAMAARADVLILDEPLAGLSPMQRDSILTAISKTKENTAIVIIEHLIPTIAPYVDRMMVLSGGSIIANDSVEAVVRNPQVVESYLGAPLELIK